MQKIKSMCYNRIMLKTKNKAIIGVAVVISVISAISSCLLMRRISAATCNGSPCNANTTFQVDVKEVLSVSVTTPTDYGGGYAGELLTGQIDITVASNNSGGFSTGIRASDQDATLVGDNNGALSNLESSVSGSNFPAGRWGYSLGDEDPLSKTYIYSPLSAYNTTPYRIESISSGGAGSAAGSVYFAAKAGYDNPAGTYTGTVNISVVSGSASPDPGSNPVGPDPQGGTTPSYHNENNENVTTYTTRTQSSDTPPTKDTTTTEISSGDNRTYYASPQGETERTESNVKTNSSLLPVILATTSAVSAAAGLGFFIVAKRREEEEEDEEELE